jgi:hypothetical protein
LREVTVSACVVETCGRQNITCPGLKVMKGCTPGYDCMFNCPMFCTVVDRCVLVHFEGMGR